MKKYDCLLINPRPYHYSKAQKTTPYMPAGLLSIASVLKNAGSEPFVLDMIAEDDPIRTLSAFMGASPQSVRLVGFTVMTTQIHHAAELSRYIKATFPGVSVIWGGIHPSLFPEGVLREKLADFVCTGEGEYAASELLSALKDGSDPRKVRGLHFLAGDELIFTGSREPNDLDALPFLNFDLIDYSNYRARKVFRGSEHLDVRAGIVISSVGCPYRCTFCVNVNKKLARGSYRSKSASRLADEIEFLIARHGIDYFDFLDENFFVRRSHPEEFVREVGRRGLKFRWNTNIRADAFDRGLIDDPLLGRLAEAGLYYLGIGAESASQRILDKLKKDITAAQISATVRRVLARGIGASLSFMMGIPGETKEDVSATLRLIRELRALGGKVSIIGPQVFRPYPGGELYDECVSSYGYAPPNSVTAWGDSVDPLTGFEDIDNLPWITDKNFIKKVAFYMEFANINIDVLRFGPMKRLIFLFLKAVADFRIRHGFWAFTLEMFLILRYKKVRAAA
ncbi:MAG TPA: radical SAM protein [Elusimicrobiales bacterium]|nr:radical SAM protein [Elusimicrobiales bacterium]